MADFFYMNKRTVSTGRTREYARYVNRAGKYEHRGDLIDAEHANLPNGCEVADDFFQALDGNERANGGATEYTVALPREFSPAERRAVANDLALRIAGPSPVVWAVHCPPAALEGGEQPHLHALVCHRVPDGIQRPLEQVFRRFNAKDPQRGGWRKDCGGVSRAEVKAKLRGQRELVTAVLNQHLTEAGSEHRVDHRSYKERGIDKKPMDHLGPNKVTQLLRARREV